MCWLTVNNIPQTCRSSFLFKEIAAFAYSIKILNNSPFIQGNLTSKAITHCCELPAHFFISSPCSDHPPTSMPHLSTICHSAHSLSAAKLLVNFSSVINSTIPFFEIKRSFCLVHFGKLIEYKKFCSQAPKFLFDLFWSRMLQWVLKFRVYSETATLDLRVSILVQDFWIQLCNSAL